jgi:tetraprenyl-beta-curcumene synthase
MAALDAYTTKHNGAEGTAAFAAFVPANTRVRVVRAIVSFQLCLDYIDTLGELPHPDPIANGQTLNKALLVAFQPGLPHPDYYAALPCHDDAGYLEDLVDACRVAVGSLPSFSAAAEPARRALSRIVGYQSLNHGDAYGSHAKFADWARSQSVRGADLRWWETGAAAGSHLSALALIAAAANPSMSLEHATAIEHAYFPWIGALSTLLDGVIDQYRDHMEGQRSLIDYYSSPQEAAERLRGIAVEALRAIRALPDADNHALIVEAMAAFFHSASEASAPDVGLTTRAVLDAMGKTAPAAFLILKARNALTHRSPTPPPRPTPSPTPPIPPIQPAPRMPSIQPLPLTLPTLRTSPTQPLPSTMPAPRTRPTPHYTTAVTSTMSNMSP